MGSLSEARSSSGSTAVVPPVLCWGRATEVDGVCGGGTGFVIVSRLGDLGYPLFFFPTAVYCIYPGYRSSSVYNRCTSVHMASLST